MVQSEFKKMNKVFFVLLSVLMVQLMPINAFSAQSLPPIHSLFTKKSMIADELVKSVEACVLRKDTNHVTFNGCIDWHSSVHGVWALVAYMNATQDRRFDDLIEKKLRPDKIRRERVLINRHPRFEMPYGRAWFLRLAIEYEQYSNNKTLRPMADDVLRSLIDYYKRNKPNPHSDSYNSASWALINMHDYAMYVKDRKTSEFVKKIIRKYYIVKNAVCKYREEKNSFMAICTNWAWLVSKALPKDKYVLWVRDFFDRNGLPSPLQHPKSWHRHGLNFSRCWGLWEIYAIAGEDKYLDAYVKHFTASFDRPKLWRGSYHGVGHWVPQFGMFALQPLFGKNGRYPQSTNTLPRPNKKLEN
jgi:hypothetical protein